MSRKRLTLYILYGFFITAVFLWWQFPSEAVTGHLFAAIHDRNPEMVISAEDSTFGILPSVTLRKATLRFINTPNSLLEADVVKIRPAIMQGLQGRLSCLVDANAYGGRIHARVNFIHRFTTRSPIAATMDLARVNVGDCTLLKKHLGRKITGILDGSLTFSGRYEQAMKGTGDAKLTLTQGTIQLLKSMFGFDALTFDSISAQLALRNGTLKVDSITFRGKELRGSLKGNVYINRNINQSRLALKGSVEIPALNRTFSTYIGGTFNKPIPRLM